MKTSFLSKDELIVLGFKKLGKGVQISRRASFYNISNIEVGDFSRIDDFCVFSGGRGGISIGRHVHIGVSSTCIGDGNICIKDFANISSRVSIYSSNDDYSGEWMTNPTLPSNLTNVMSKPVCIEEHVIVGCGSVILPGVTMYKGSGAGALSLIKDNCEPSVLYAGRPAKKISKRSSACFDLANRVFS